MNIKLVRCKDCKYAQILKRTNLCMVTLKKIQIEVPKECRSFEKKCLRELINL